MRRAARMVVAAGCGILAAGCGGIWQESLAELWSELTVDLELAVPESDPNRPAAQHLIDDGWIAAWEGQVGMGGAISFSVALQEVTVDGQILDGEVVKLRERMRDLDAPPVEPERRAELLQLKRVMDDAERAERGAPAPAGSAFELRPALEQQGFAIGGCEQGVDPGLSWTRCDADRGEQHVLAMAEQFDDAAEARGAEAEPTAARVGNTVLTITVFDRARAATLRDHLTSGVDRLDTWTDEHLRSALEQRDWSVVTWEPRTDGAGSTVSCVAQAGDRVAMVELVRSAGDGPLQRSVTPRQATLTAGASVLTVTVEDRSAASLVLSQIMP